MVIEAPFDPQVSSGLEDKIRIILHKLSYPIVHFSEPFLVLNGKSRKRAGAPIFLLLSVPATNKSTIRLKSFFTSSVKLSLLQLL